MKNSITRFFVRICCTAAALVCVVFHGDFASAEDWPSIRGPQFDGSASTEDIELSAGPLNLKVAWKVPFGSGYSGIAKSGDRLVSAMADEEAEQEFLVAIAADSGKTLWRTSTGKIMKGENGSFDGPLATPAVNQTHAFHLSPFGDLAAYSLQDGSVEWTVNLKDRFSVAANFYGFGASPVLIDDVLIVAVGANDGAVMGFSPETGDVLWKAGSDEAAFQTPVPMEINGQSCVIAATNTKLIAIDPTTGNARWTQSHGGASGMPAWSVMPVPVPGRGVFLNDRKDRSVVVDLKNDGAVERWSGRDIRNSYCVPVMSGGLLCSYSSRFLVAVDPQTGQRKWRARSPGDGFVGTVAGRLVVATLKGNLHIGDVTEDGFDEVATTEVFRTGGDNSEGLIWSLPAIAGRSVFLRSLGAIARVDVSPATSSPVDAPADHPEQGSVVSGSFAGFLERVEASQKKQTEIDQFLNDKSMPFTDGEVTHFVLQGDYQDVAVASELFGIRQERTMQRVKGTDLFYFGVRLPESTRASYVFYADYQPITDPMNSRQTVSSTVAGEMEPTFMGPAKPLTFSWFEKGEISSSLPKSIDAVKQDLAGTIETFELDSAAMKEKIPVAVYLPSGYAESEEDYPVVFVHEGKLAMEQGNQAAIVDELIQIKEIRPTIAVFVQRRFYPMLGADGYPQMFAGELLPRITSTYRISNDRMDRSSMSGGFGATLALMGTLPAGNEIGRIGCHSPFAFELLHPVIAQLANLPTQHCQVLIQWAKYEMRNPSENWNMSIQSKAIATMLSDGGHTVITEPTLTGSDWVCWRTESVRMWKFLVGQ